MRYYALVLLLLVSSAVFAQNRTTSQALSDERAVLIKSIVIDGFVLGDKDRFVKIFKPYRNKYLTTADMDGILQKIQDIYEREGYKELVGISYQLVKHRLVYTVLMTS